MKRLAIAALVTLGVVSAVHAAGDATAGQSKAVTCTACHGADGNSITPIWPKLAGQHASYIQKQLADFKSGARKDATMIGMVAPLSDQDMADLAAYYSTQTVAIGSADTEQAALGKKIYHGGIAEKAVPACMACHGPNGAGNPGATFPSLTGQHVDYVVKAMSEFRSGTRDNDPAQMMRDLAAKMSDTEIKAVAAYIAGLH